MAAQNPENQQSFLQRMFGARPKPAPASFPQPKKPPSGSFPPGSEEAYLAALPVAAFGAPVDNYFSNFFEDLNDLAIQGRVVHSDKLNLRTVLGRGKSKGDWLKEIDTETDPTKQEALKTAYNEWEGDARYSVIKPALKDYFSPGRYISRTGKSLVYQYVWNNYLADRFLKGAVEKGYGIAEEVKYGGVEGIKVDYLEPTYPPTGGPKRGLLKVEGKDVYLRDNGGNLVNFHIDPRTGKRVEDKVGTADNYGRIIEIKDPGGRVINIKYTPLKDHPELRNAGVWRGNLDRLVKPTGSSDPTLSAVMGISEKDRPFLERWFSPKTFRSGLFSGTGRLGEWRSFLDHPFTYAFGKFIYREYPLPGGKGGFGLRKLPGPWKLLRGRGVLREVQKHGVFGGFTRALYKGQVKPPVVTAVKTVGARAGKAAGKAAGQVIGGGIRKIIAAVVRQIITKGLAALGSVAGPIGTAIGYIAGFIVTRFFKWIVLIGCGCIFLFLGLVGFIIFIIITFFFGFAPIKGEAAEIPPSLLAIEKKVSCAGSAFGGSCQIEKGAIGLAALVSYTITVTNNSDKPAASIVVTDTFSEPLGVESSYLLASLEPGASDTKTYSVITIPNTSSERIISNTASVAGVIDGKSEAGSESTAQVIVGEPPDTIPCGWPASGNISTLFGEPTIAEEHHSGVDIAANGDDVRNGQAVYSSLSGTLDFVESRGSGVAVTFISTVGGKNYSATYRHLHANVFTNWKSKGGSRIAGGTLIGFTNPGAIPKLSSGTHLHYETRVDGELVDPLKFTGNAVSGAEVTAGGCWWRP